MAQPKEVRISIDSTLKQRAATHGAFEKNAAVAQQLKDAFRSMKGWSEMEPFKKEALDHICTKISRIVTSDSDYVDNWHDIQGYASLVERLISDKKLSTQFQEELKLSKPK